MPGNQFTRKFHRGGVVGDQVARAYQTRCLSRAAAYIHPQPVERQRAASDFRRGEALEREIPYLGVLFKKSGDYLKSANMMMKRSFFR